MEERYYKYLLQNAAYNMILNKKNQSIYWNEYSVVDDDNDNGSSLNRSISNKNQYYWLDELRDLICPRIMNQYYNSLFYLNRNFDNYSSSDDSSDNVNSSKYHINDTNSDSYNHITTTSTNTTSSATTATTTVVNHNYMSMYSKVLHLLQAADASGLWPTTTVARSKVIQSVDSSSSSGSSMVSNSSSYYYR
jgi:hypothetical protein